MHLQPSAEMDCDQSYCRPYSAFRTRPTHLFVTVTIQLGLIPRLRSQLPSFAMTGKSQEKFNVLSSIVGRLRLLTSAKNYRANPSVLSTRSAPLSMCAKYSA